MSNGKIVIFGGGGFIGSHICKLATETRHQVISIARKGRPHGRAPWMDTIEWVKADIFESDSWRSYLSNCDAAIHCIGQLLETPSRGLTYHRVNGESAILTSRASQEAGVGSFVFLSAAATPPLIPSAYLEAKRRAETFVQATNSHWAVLRPALVYSWDRAWSVLPGQVGRLLASLPLLRDRIGSLRPLPADVVATTALRAAMEPNIAGILDVDLIDRLGRSKLREWQPEPIPNVA